MNADDRGAVRNDFQSTISPVNWQVKALLQLFFSFVPWGEQLNYFVQRRVVKSLPISDASFVAAVSYATKHIEAILRYAHRPLTQSTFYEFGAGWDLVTALAFYGFGVDKQILVDVRGLARPRLLNDTINKYRRMGSQLGVPRIPTSDLSCEKCTLVTELKGLYGIDYRVPCDARQTGLRAQSVDCITSTSTLEHIPEKDIRKIVRECHRILHNDGIMTMLIDYDDHYSYSDRNISPYNYLQYSDHVWGLFNPSLHYQNRLRHPDYIELFQSEGFYVTEDHHKEATEKDLNTLRQISLSERFRTYSASDLAVHNGFLVLRKRLAEG